MTTFPWLTIIVLLPISAALLIPWFPQRGNHWVRWYALGICLLDLVLMTYVFASYYEISDVHIQMKEDYTWISSLDFHWRLGLDGISIALFLLTGFITSLATLAAWPVTRNPKLFYFLMLAMYSGQLGLFASQDILLFFLMWELELIPVYLLLSLWGGKRRLYAASKFILYTAAGSVFLLAAALTASLWNSSIPVLDMTELSSKQYPLNIEILIYIGFFIAYAVKLPLIPLHTWLPDTHGEAHYSTCMLLAGILLKMGGYGFIRINMELLPHAHIIFSPWLVSFGAVQIVYGALVSFGQTNLKRRIAYSSVSHMGFVLIGIGAVSDLALNGAMVQMISHGLIGAGLFFLAGTSYDRIGTTILSEMGGWASLMPKMFNMLTILAMASLALPGMSGFISELMVFLGLLSSNAYSPFFRLIITILEAFGIILTPIYLLSMIRQMFYGSNNKLFYKFQQDAGPREVFIFSALLLPVLSIGIYPNLILPLWQHKTELVTNNLTISTSFKRAFYENL